uniref:asparaginase n=1 Tax=Rhodococcus qingshengii TaxID=334542 RepID=UPI001C4DFF74|nr:asparaginase [Rhodococcus qingshengii]
MKNLYNSSTDSLSSLEMIDRQRSGPRHVVLAVQTRGSVIENVHHGSVVVTAPDGAISASAGDPTGVFFARSALKPLQALAMIRLGLDLNGEALALATSSHSGAPDHLAKVERILSSYGLSPTALANTPGLPLGVREQERWLREGRPASALVQNCSGKHAAMLATCVLNGWSLADYLDPDHPLQHAIRREIEDVLGQTVFATAVDGCGAPVFATRLDSLAHAYGQLAAAARDTPEGRIALAMCTHPASVAGEERDVTAAMRAYPGMVAKDGADGVQLLGLPDGRGIAVKIADGQGRVRMPVTVRALRYAGVSRPELDVLATSPTLGADAPVGELRAIEFFGSAEVQA